MQILFTEPANFEDRLKIDYQPEDKSYILESNNQIYNAGLSVIDKR